MISLCITTYNRSHLTIESFKQVLQDDRIGEIVIVDDFSVNKYFRELQDFERIRHASVPKIRLYRNPKNLGCYYNKAEAISKATHEFCILFDSDNVLTKEYIDAIHSVSWKADTILAPEFARPHFNYTAYTGLTISKQNVRQYIGKKNFDALLNTCNYFVNREQYLRVFDFNTRETLGMAEPWTADTIYQNYNWLKAGNKIHVLKNLQYDHRIENYGAEDRSHYQQHNRKTGKLNETIQERMKQL